MVESPPIHLVTINGKLHTESIGLAESYTDREMEAIPCIPTPPLEMEYYSSIAKAVAHRVGEFTSEDLLTSRQIVVTFPQEGSVRSQCITAIQLLLGRGPDSTMIVFQRSLNSHLHRFDEHFLSHLAQSFDCHRLIWIVGSLHTEVQV